MACIWHKLWAAARFKDSKLRWVSIDPEAAQFFFVIGNR